MTISSRVQRTLFTSSEVIRLPPTVLQQYEERQFKADKRHQPLRRTNIWTREEHERFLQGLEQFPQGPWKQIAELVGTKTTRQTMTHAQKYRQKIERRQRALEHPQTRKRSRAASTATRRAPVLPTHVPTNIDLPLVRVPSVLRSQLPALDPPVNNDELPKLELCEADLADLPMIDLGSPHDITQIFDASVVDPEFDELIESLGPMPVYW
ncbi:hypothetical protein Poli38472_008101 [Pythium oligandrum]|uniref:Uncharacterized protein n=1 Tax=Pythium oligandrum TaxID=41045 RepID=A0A8K1FLP3_PYTOL|nr:hypothetical protein Poli38472_008101 [Pythium oligandrum]|eukprot:TMW65459.1 hypothetical protein Poli38472_008101 [Pythium oligandrum]